MKLRHYALALAMFAADAQTAMAGNFSFVGSFIHDTDVKLFNFSIAADSSSVIVKTLSVQGGINAVGSFITPGGFETYLALFKADGTAVTNTQSKPLGQDAIISIVGTLLAGDYIVALSQFDNLAVGDLGDGFAADYGIASFSGAPFSVFGGDGHWAVDISFVDRADAVNRVPEPGSLALALIGGWVGFCRRRQVA